MSALDFGHPAAAAPMSKAEERDHWLTRAEVHLDLGSEAPDTRASWAHLQLAERYLDRVYGEREDA